MTKYVHLYNVLQLEDILMQGTCSTFTCTLKQYTYLYCLRHEWRESVCLKGKYMQKSFCCISKKLVRRSLLFTMLTQQQISKTMKQIKNRGEKKEMSS
jgi:hypothetical protein